METRRVPARIREHPHHEESNQTCRPSTPKGGHEQFEDVLWINAIPFTSRAMLQTETEESETLKYPWRCLYPRIPGIRGSLSEGTDSSYPEVKGGKDINILLLLL